MRIDYESDFDTLAAASWEAMQDIASASTACHVSTALTSKPTAMIQSPPQVTAPPLQPEPSQAFLFLCNNHKPSLHFSKNSRRTPGGVWENSAANRRALQLTWSKPLGIPTCPNHAFLKSSLLTKQPTVPWWRARLRKQRRLACPPVAPYRACLPGGSSSPRLDLAWRRLTSPGSGASSRSAATPSLAGCSPRGCCT